ncbi:hypothetical protein [Streptomonospora litoralis]|uniref:Uncharacterized protein n=1 Tax=Streptomonospora litoralis TaxID=2498135 RepID=A0A4P6PZP9_9ACTN|nr:hypothetical protein [Streptomonospora litoralis]QBI53806.1 hypothetical protein EKD16_10100 [Streptomonospora litoralis]
MTNRRGNGLLADTYVPLILLPRAPADQMLDALRESGIAAYAVQLDEGVLEESGAVAEPPTDHLYVDSRERAAAEAILRDQLPDLERFSSDSGAAESAEPSEIPRHQPSAEPEAPVGSADDDVWADLVARFYDTPGPAEAAWPDAENLADNERTADAEEGATDTAEGGEDPRAADDTAGSPRGRVVRPAEPGDDHDHYVPPPPPPLPRGDLTSRLSWAGLFGGPLVLLGSMLLGMSLPGWVAFLAVAAFIAGFVVLVVRMGDRPPGDNGPDDGAVV